MQTTPHFKFKAMFIRNARTLLYTVLLFGCVGLIFLYNFTGTGRADEDPLRLDYVMGKPLEKINLDYKKNIFFSVKTSVKNYRTRLSLLLLTWFQTVDKDQLFIISDNPSRDVKFVHAIRNAGYNLIPSNCKDSHKPLDLCCKTGQECGTYYKELREHPSEKDRYQWFCHFDDDVYVNVKQLSNLLQQYDHTKPYYIGRWPREVYVNEFLEAASEELINVKRFNYPIHTVQYKYATGSTRCMSYAMMMEVAEFFNYTTRYCQVALRSDDVSQGFIVEIVLGHELTSVDEIHGQFEDISQASAEEIKKYVTVSYRRRPGIDHLINHVNIPSNFSDDEQRFKAYHCLLYPEVSWCHNSSPTV